MSSADCKVHTSVSLPQELSQKYKKNSKNMSDDNRTQKIYSFVLKESEESERNMGHLAFHKLSGPRVFLHSL